MTTARVGFIGLGRMGKPMALNLLASGFSVVVMSRSRDPIEHLVRAGAGEARSAQAMAAESDIICTCLPDEPTSRDVYLGPEGLIQFAGPNHLFIENSTIGPSLARQVNREARGKGSAYLDAPISGGVERAIDASLTVMAGGDEDSFKAARSVFEAIGSSVYHVGPVGQGCVTKLTNQLLVAVHTLAACEAFLFGTSAGADPDQLLSVLGTAWGASTMLQRNGPLLVTGDYGSRAPTRLLVKDLALVMEVAGELGIDLPTGQRTQLLYEKAMAEGLGELDIAAIVTLLAAD